MELNILEQGLATNRTIFEQSLEQSIDTEFTLPDYYPEVERILKCRVVPRLSSKALNGGTLVIDGTAAITLIYASAEGEISGFDYQVPFSKTVDSACAQAEPSDGLFVFCGVLLDYATCRAVTPRRISVRGSVVMKPKVVCRKTVEIIADIDDDCVQTQKGETKATVPVSVTEKQFSLEEEMEIPQGKPTALSVIRSSATAIVTECKIISNKAVVKGRLCIDALYRAESGCECFKNEIPFNQIIDVFGIDEDCAATARAEICAFDLRTKTGMSGEARTFVADARVGLCIEAFCERDVALIYDAFSTRFRENISRSDIALERFVQGADETFLCKKTIEFPDGTFSGLTDVWCDAGGETVRAEGDTIIIAGEITVCILGQDAQSGAVFYERPAPFEYRLRLNKTPENLRCIPQVQISGLDYELGGTGRVEIRAELKITAAVTETVTVSVLSDFSLDEDNPKSRGESALVIYFADQGEKLWDIAKRYNTSPTEIASVNELEAEKLDNGRMLLIPRV
ncbi:MAG: DUF3794 and LysM peptidoglycan-binding domain-containing protein [Candidatus Howiella sp.]|jgi:LysM repeat protein